MGIALLLITSRRREIETKNTSCEEHCAPDELNQKLPPGYAYRDYKHSTEGEHRTAEQFIWQSQKTISTWTLIAAIVAAAFSLGSVIYTGKQAFIAQQALLQTNRAWMTISPNEADTFVAWDNLLLIDVPLTAANVGNSPALQVSLFAKILTLDSSQDWPGRVKDACSEGGNFGRLVSQKDSFLDRVGGYMSPTAIESALNDIRRKQHRFTNIFPFWTVFCAKYKIIGDDTVHHTGKIYFVSRPNHILPSFGVNMPVGQVNLVPDARGDYAD